MTQELLKFIDCFGIQFGFYLDGKSKYYSTIGGILTMIAFLISIISFFIFKCDDFKRKNPILYSYELPYSNKYNQESEKILIPFRIISIDHNLINKDIFISIFSNNKSYPSKLCNKTELEIRFNNYYLNSNLDKLYCIEITEIQINSTIDSNLSNTIKLEVNSNENINDYGIEIFLPTIKTLPKNYKNPFYIFFKHYIYFFNLLTYKADNLFLQKNIFINDNGWINKNVKNTSVISYNSIKSDFNIKENNSTLLYSLNIKLESFIKYNERSFNKLQKILSDSFPLFYAFFWIFHCISRAFKLSEEKKKIFESMFENLVEKKDKLTLFAKKVEENNKKKIAEEDRSVSKINFFDDHHSNILSINNKREEGMDNTNIILKRMNYNRPRKRIDSAYLRRNNEFKNNITPLSIKLNSLSKDVSPSNVNKNPDNTKFSKNSVNIISCNASLLIHKQQDLIPIKMMDKKYEKKLLFPYKFYLLSIFCKNTIKISSEKLKFNKCWNKKLRQFIKLNDYIGHFLDLESYIILQREFNILKEKLFNKKHFSLIEYYAKININDHLEVKRLLECVDTKKDTHIF